ncbi:hypothetical protein EDD17DRAFT_1511439 [Pisolithus thermaeus]|nr:hypothetical protein EDD17DRAFT_1511439 [Pisolithus thermaeus]
MRETYEDGLSGQEEPIDPQVESIGHNGKDNMMSSGNVDLEPVEAALLAGDSQDAYRGQNDQPQDPKNVPTRPPDQGIHEDESNSKLEITSRNLTIKSRTLEECPEGVRKWCSVNMNMSSRTRGLGGQDKVSKRLGVVKGEWKCQNDGKQVKTDGQKCQEDGGMSSTCCGSKQAKTKLLAEEKIGQHQWWQCKLRDIPGPPKRLGMHTYEPTRPKH